MNSAGRVTHASAVGIAASDGRSSSWYVLLVASLWYRAHTFAPTISAVSGVNLWPAASGASEPLDCDEAAYAYIGHRLLRGDVMYRDLTENKPPLGYWLYALAVAIGGYNELAIRLLPIPAVLISIAHDLVDRRAACRFARRLPGRRAIRRAQHRSLPVR